MSWLLLGPLAREDRLGEYFSMLLGPARGGGCVEMKSVLCRHTCHVGAREWNISRLGIEVIFRIDYNNSQNKLVYRRQLDGKVRTVHTSRWLFFLIPNDISAELIDWTFQYRQPNRLSGVIKAVENDRRQFLDERVLSTIWFICSEVKY